MLKDEKCIKATLSSHPGRNPWLGQTIPIGILTTATPDENPRSTMQQRDTPRLKRTRIQKRLHTGAQKSRSVNQRAHDFNDSRTQGINNLPSVGVTRWSHKNACILHLPWLVLSIFAELVFPLLSVWASWMLELPAVHAFLLPREDNAAPNRVFVASSIGQSLCCGVPFPRTAPVRTASSVAYD